MKRLIKVILLFICLQFLFAVNTAAYLDPSAMTYLIQAVAGVLIAGGAAVAIYWKKIKIFIKKKKKQARMKTEKAKQEGMKGEE